jgi:hypothetical protein
VQNGKYAQVIHREYIASAVITSTHTDEGPWHGSSVSSAEE